MIPCEICQEEGGFLTCRHVGPVCFDCWGSGIHEAMKRKALVSSEKFKVLWAKLNQLLADIRYLNRKQEVAS